MAMMSGEFLAGSKREFVILCSFCAHLSVSKAMAPGWNEMPPVKVRGMVSSTEFFPLTFAHERSTATFSGHVFERWPKEVSVSPKEGYKKRI